MNEQQVQPAPARNQVEQMVQFVTPPGMFNTLRNIEMIARIIMSWSSATLDVFIHREFGERYLSVGRIILGWMTIQFFLSIAGLQNTLSWIPGIPSTGSDPSINSWYLISYAVLSGIHLLRIWQRNQAGVIWHSRSFGVSWLDFLTHLPPLRLGRYELRITEWMLYRFLEPGLCFALAMFLMPISFTRSWLLWASFTMFIHNSMIWNAKRQKFLDMIDGHIEGGYYNDLRSDALGQGAGSDKRQMGYAEIPIPTVLMSELAAPVDFSATVAETMGTGEETRQLEMDSVLKPNKEA